MRKSQTLRVGAAILAATGALAFTTIPSSAAPSAAAELPDGPALARNLAKKVTGAGVNRHLIALQRIADKNGGNRAAGTPGHRQSAEYVESQLVAAGFDVTRHEFPFTFTQTLAEKLTVAGAAVPISIMTYSLSTPTGGITAPLAVVPVDATPGCEVSDFVGVTGKIALIQRGACPFADKQANAFAAGAVGAIIYNNVDGGLAGTLSDPANAKLPTGGVSKADGERLAASSNGASVTLELRALREDRTTYNVIAQTKTGRKNNVVFAGAHLDSVVAGPGINDNGSGSAGLLETAIQLGGSPKVNNAVRFAWWSAEELGLVGSKKYVQSLTFEQQLDIALYLNFDMIASPNTGYFVYDGDNSDGVGAGEGPYGSAQIEAAFHSFLNTTGTPTEGTDFTGRSDYGEFIANGIPAGGLFTGAEQLKTQAQADKWGGVAGVAYDKNYHGKGDNLGNIDRVALDRNSDAIAWVTASYAISTEDINGVPPRAARAQARVAAKSKARAQLVHEDEVAEAHGAGCIHVNELAI
ncbi:M28 family metallopeptidase [Actinokineospora terrae]|uniref:Zn-dependent amino-or carboxypeptidase, M28 family n=1 Tax=Actinokineospora terrae TaxID=155974 RepID=A0A1H9XK58_9PSEU|nr:M28 family metallopeptidase [Actinokineospora terrae]SES46566.1 Zn-dependent amino-or carboxypeptidase, M28 family [Actinokineospora terrae]